MADTYIIRHETLDSIAEAIKTKRGRNEDIRTEEMAEEILNISNAELPELANPGDAEDLAQGVQMIDETGAVVTGTFTIDNEISETNVLLTNIRNALEGKAISENTSIKTYTAIFSDIETIIEYCNVYFSTVDNSGNVITKTLNEDMTSTLTYKIVANTPVVFICRSPISDIVATNGTTYKYSHSSEGGDIVFVCVFEMQSNITFTPRSNEPI